MKSQEGIVKRDSTQILKLRTTFPILEALVSPVTRPVVPQRAGECPTEGWGMSHMYRNALSTLLAYQDILSATANSSWFFAGNIKTLLQLVYEQCDSATLYGGQ